MSDGLLKFWLLCLTLCGVLAYFGGHWWVVAVGLVACYVGWLVHAAGKEVDQILRQLDSRRVLAVAKVPRRSR